MSNAQPTVLIDTARLDLFSLRPSLESVRCRLFRKQSYFLLCAVIFDFSTRVVIVSSLWLSFHKDDLSLVWFNDRTLMLSFINSVLCLGLKPCILCILGAKVKRQVRVLACHHNSTLTVLNRIRQVLIIRERVDCGLVNVGLWEPILILTRHL